MNCDYTAARADTDNPENLFIKANMACKQFFNGNEETGYQEVNLSKPSYSASNLSELDVLRDKNAVYRTKRLDPSRPEYSEHSDEKKHDMDMRYMTPELEHIFAFFKGKPCRVRIARMAAGYRIKPHVDYDPSYIFRYHIPLLTNADALLHSDRRSANGSPSETHFQTDGRVYWINTGLLHWASNDGSTDRYHLLIDVTGDLEQHNMEHIEFYG
jgi:hypothetical protein